MTFIAFILILPVLASAQTESITAGINWLLSNQNPDGSWSAEPRIYLDTYTALETLLYLDIDSAQVSQAVSWINAQDLNTSDDLSHKVLLLSLSEGDTSGDLSTLLTYQNSDDVWGTDQDFSSDILDTALALQALKAVNYSDQTVINNAISYLLSTQNPDGGWGFYPSTCSGCAPDDSNVYMTAVVLETLSQFKSIYDL